MNLCGYEPCQIEVFGRQKFCSADHRKAALGHTRRAGRRRRPVLGSSITSATGDHASERRAKLWPCTNCQGLIYHVSKPRDVCAQCRRESQLTSIKVAPRVDDPLRPAQVYFGTMNVNTTIRGP